MSSARESTRSFGFVPPHRQARVPDAGLPSFGYHPEKGKKSPIYNDEIQRVNSNMAVSVNSPDYFKSAMKFSAQSAAGMLHGENAGAIARDRRDPNVERPRAAGLTCVEKAKAAELRTHDPSRTNVQAMCSQQSPRFFKSPIDNNKPFFEKTAKELNVATDGYNFEPSIAKEKEQNRAACVAHMKGHTGANVYCSAGSPDWMKTTFESNAQHFKDYGVPVHRKGSASSDIYREYPIEKRINLVSHEGAETCHPLVVSKVAPRWMMSPYLSNKQFFEEKTGQKLQESQFIDTGFRQRPGAKTARRNMLSLDQTPCWMKSSRALPQSEAPHPEVQTHHSYHQRQTTNIEHVSTLQKRALQGGTTLKDITSAKSPASPGSRRSGSSPASPTSRRSNDRSSKAPASARQPRSSASQQGSRGSQTQRQRR